MLNINVSCYGVNVQKQRCIGVLQKSCSVQQNHGDITISMQKRRKFTGDYPCKSVISIKLHSKNSSINLHFSKCRLVLILRLKS